MSSLMPRLPLRLNASPDRQCVTIPQPGAQASTEQLAESLRAHLSQSVTQSLEQYANNLAVVVQANPQGSAEEILNRPDIRQSLAASLSSARSAARAALAQSYTAASPGTDESSPLYHSLVQDINAAYAAAPQVIYDAVLHAFTQHPDVPFQPGIHEPGENPSFQAALQRAQAAHSAITQSGSSLALRNGLSVAVAVAGGRTEALLADASAQEQQNPALKLGKRWAASMDGKDPKSCAWCKALHGVIVPIADQFPHPSQIGGHKPPKLYMGMLPGPGFLHPHCRCNLEIVVIDNPQPPVYPHGYTAPYAAHAMVSSTDIASMPPERYEKLRHFLSSALHELGQMIARLLKL